MFGSVLPPETCNQLPGWLAKLRRHFPRVVAGYATLDARSLGLGRIYLGLLLLTDLLRRVPYLNTYYTNEGLLPNHTILWQPRAEYPFSLFFLASTPLEATLLFALCGGVFCMLLIGYRTRLFQVLSLICICSLHNRLTFFDDGSETSTRLLAFWTVFLPLGARFSVDAVRESRARAAHAAHAEGPEPERASSNAVVSLAVTAILLQLALIYVFNALHKDGQTWRDGSVVHYVLHQDRIVTWLGLMLRPHVGLLESQIMTWSALATEAVLPLLILSPIAQRYTRLVAVVLGIGLHLNFALLLNLGLFSANMIGFFLLLLGAADWQWLGRAVAARPGLARAWAEIERACLSGSERVLRAWHGPVDTIAPRGSWPSWWAERAPALREATVVVYAIALASAMSNANRAVPRFLRMPNPTPLRMLVAYPRLYQGWGMFAPDAPLDDIHLVIDAVTADGRHVDPLNQLGSRVADPGLREIPERLGHDDGYCDYVVNIQRVPEYHGALIDWIHAYPVRTGREQDRIVSFKIWVLTDDSPTPGLTHPTHTRRRLLLKE